MPVIKRYPNRKLYDTDTKRYVTLDEVAEMVRLGEEVQVVDFATGEDLTALTLTQIIFDQEKKQSGFLPQHLLTGLVRSGGSRLSAIQRSLVTSLGLNRLVNDEIERRVRELASHGLINDEQASRWLEKLLSSEAAGASHQPLDEEVVERVLTERGLPTGSEFEKLLEQIEVLTDRLEELEKPCPDSSE
jgi:polyhydroxyalkanoate synthesis repressor PhaR